MSHEIAVRRWAVLEANHDVIVIGEERPRLQNQRVIFRQVESCIAQEIHLSTGVEKPLSMQCRRGNEVNAVRRKVVGRRVWPTLAHHGFLSQFLSFRASLMSESDARPHRTPKALRAKPTAVRFSVSRQLWECVRVLAPLFLFRILSFEIYL